MTEVLDSRASLPRSTDPIAFQTCPRCTSRDMLVARETRETAQTECVACGTAQRVYWFDGAARWLHALPRFHLSRRHARARPRPTRAELHALAGLDAPA